MNTASATETGQLTSCFLELNELCALETIKKLPSPPKVIILTAFDIIEYREAASEENADDYVEKKSLVNDLLPAIRGTK